MSYNFKNLPKSLKKTLKTVSKNYDFKIEDCLVLTEKEGKNVVSIDFKFEQKYKASRIVVFPTLLWP